MKFIKRIVSPLNIFLILILFLCSGIVYLQQYKNNQEIVQFIIELLGSFTVTFLGIYFSLRYSKSQDEAKEKIRSENYYKTSLVLIASEIDFNITTLECLLLGIDTMPRIITNYYTSYGALIEVARSIKTNAYYSTFMTQSIHEIIKNMEIFNSLQIGYNNMELAVNGLYQTKDVFHEYLLLDKNHIPLDIIEQLNKMINEERNKIQRAIDMLSEAKQNCENELKRFDLIFSKKINGITPVSNNS